MGLKIIQQPALAAGFFYGLYFFNTLGNLLQRHYLYMA
jgi:hypothetical protein